MSDQAMEKRPNGGKAATTAVAAAPASPGTPAAKKPKGDNDWTSSDPDCPEDLVVNAGNRPLVIGAPAFVPHDSPRIDVGDRRRGPYYLKMIGLPIGLGLQRVKDLSLERLRELEKIRQIRTGERPADWILEARRRAEEGNGPPVFEDKRTAMSALQKAAQGMATEE